MATVRFIDTCGQPAKRARLVVENPVVKEWVDKLMPHDWAYHEAIKKIENDDICIKVLAYLLTNNYSSIDERGDFLKEYEVPEGTPLWMAAARGRLKVVQWLVDHNASIEIPGVLFGETPLFCAASNGHLEVVKLLAELGASKETVNGYGQTPLYIAAEKGYIDIVKLLVEKGGADLDIAETFFGKTPLYIAAEKGFTDIVKLLERNGANINKKNLVGHTPRDAADAAGHYDLAWWLDALNETRATNQMLKSRSAANK